MSKGKEKNCRICLEILENDNNTIEEITREIFNVLLIKIDLSVSEGPLICKSCMESAQEAYNFKSTCLAVDKQVVSFATDRNSTELDIRDVYLKENENKNVFNEEYNVCRFCLQCREKRNFRLLSDLRQSSADEMLHKCIPELDLNIVKQPVICTACLNSLETYYNFTLRCHLTEKNIMKYCEVQGAECTGQISLVNVLRFLSKGAYIDNCGKIPALEEHNTVQDEENAYSDMHNISFKIEEEKFIVKDENDDGDCKTEEQTVMMSHEDPLDVVTFRCDRCTYETKYKNHLKRHILIHKDNSEVTMYKCNLCSYEAKWRYCLKNHMLIHKDSSEVVMYKCEKCAYETKRRSNLKKHVRIHKDNSEITMYKCERCTFETRHQTCLTRHMLTHKDSSEVIMYKCSLCSYEARQKNSLKSHMLIHKESSDAGIYRCEKCTYETKHKDHLKKHVLTHKNNSEMIMYKCDLCSYETPWKYRLKNHMIIHKDSSDVVMYRCERCTFATKYKNSIKNHVLSHKDNSEVIMYKCNWCSYEAKWKYSLKNHMLIHKDSSDVKSHIPKKRIISKKK